MREPFLPARQSPKGDGGNETKETAPPPLANARHTTEKFCSHFLICARPIFSSKRKTKLFFGVLL